MVELIIYTLNCEAMYFSNENNSVALIVEIYNKTAIFADFP